MQSAAAIIVQSAWRGYATRAVLDSELLLLGSSASAVVNIQAAWRGRVARDEMLLKQLAATDIQAHWRGKLHRDDILLQHLAAVDIQSRYRGHRTRQSVKVVGVGLTVTGPTGKAVRLARTRDTLELGRGVLGLPLDNSRLHRKHVQIKWVPQSSGGTWVVQKIGKNPAYVKRAAGAGGEVPKVPSAPDQLVIRDGDTIYCSRPTPSIAVTVSFNHPTDDTRRIQRASPEATAKDDSEVQQPSSGRIRAPKPQPQPQPQLTMPNKAGRAKLFSEIDENGDGRLSLAEIDKAVVSGRIGRALKCPGFNHRPALMRAYKAADCSGNGFIQQGEFFTLLKCVRCNTVCRFDATGGLAATLQMTCSAYTRYIVYFNNLWHKFEEIDKDHDYQLNAQEFAIWCQVVGISLSSEEVAAEFLKCDANGGGQIPFGEFCKWCAKRDTGEPEANYDEEAPKLKFSVKQQHRLDQPGTVDLKIESDRVTLLAGTRAFETMLYRDVNSWSTRDGRYVDFVLTGDQHRRFATAETLAIADLLSSAATAGLLPNAVPTSYRAKSPRWSAPRTPRRARPTLLHDESIGDQETPKLVFSVKQQHRQDQPKTVDLRVDPDRLTIFTGTKAVEDILYSDIKSWSTRTGRYIEFDTVSGKHLRFATAETTPIGRLLANSAAKGRLPGRTTPVRVAAAAPPKPRARTPKQDGRARRRARTPQKQTGGRRFPITQQHLWRASRSAELVVDDRALRLMSGGETREVYSIASLLSWTLLRGSSRSELLIDHSRFQSSEVLTFGCTHEVGSALATMLAKLAPTRQLPSFSGDYASAAGSSSIYRNASAAEGGSEQVKKPRIAVEAVFTVEQLMVKFWPQAPKRLLVGIGSAGLVAFTGGSSSTVVESFPFAEIFSWTTRPSRDITVLLRSDPALQDSGASPPPTPRSDTTVRRLTLRCEESEKLSELMLRLSRRREDNGVLAGRESTGGPTEGQNDTGRISQSYRGRIAPSSPTRQPRPTSSSFSSGGTPALVSLSPAVASPGPADSATSLTARLSKLKELRAMAQREDL